MNTGVPIDASSDDGSGTSAGGRPWLTRAIPGTGGRIKARPEDFLVEEIPAYEPCGEGEHLYLFVEKRNLSTSHVVRLIAEHFGVRRDAVGVAGLKDKMAVTRQMISVHTPGKKPEDFPSFDHTGVTVHWTDRHTNKLRRGHLAGNRFIIRIRDVEPSKVVLAHKSLAMLAREGVPNVIGPQRFGHLGNNHIVGLALIKGDPERVMDELLGPKPAVPRAQAEGRALYAAGRYEEALHAFPKSLHTERRILAALARRQLPKNAVRAIERMQVGFYVTALQSAVFNRVLSERMMRPGDAGGGIGMLHAGDVAFKHDSGALFSVAGEDIESLRPRLAAFEVSPSGPMWGHRMVRACGAVDAAEVAALAGFGLSPEALEGYAKRAWDPEPGQRRPLRVQLTQPDIEAGVDEHGAYIKCRFELPRGSFATTVMDEIIKPAPHAPAPGDDAEEEEG